MKSKKLFFVFAVILFFVGTSFILEMQPLQKEWPVPAAAKAKKNPVPADAASIKVGKELWNKHCKSCHGTKGLGDGTKASQLKTDPGDFSKPAFHAQTDGEMFYRLSEGREDMPSFKKKLPDEEDRWNLVNFMRTLK